MKKVLALSAVALLAVAACSSSDDSGSSTNPTMATPTESTASPSAQPCTTDAINADVFPADGGASSVQCVNADGIYWAGGNTGPTAAGTTGTYVAQSADNAAWTLYQGECSAVPAELKEFCTSPSPSPTASS